MSYDNPRQNEHEGDPDMSRMGAKHIKPCRGANCSELILWAKHLKNDGSIGKAAPLVKAKGDEKPNIIAWFDEAQDQWLYKIKGVKNDAVRGGAPEYLNHFGNCNSRGQFKSAPQSESEQRQAEIK